MRVFLDDRRPAPEGWTLVRWPEEAIALLEAGVVWASWGRYDREQIQRDCALHGVPYEMPPHLDLKEALSTAQGWRRRYGLSKALTRCGLMPDGSHHRALDDARNTVRMLPWIVGGARTPW
jgi:inhibitor of KinA sporulation pathway (predicted exonuclease)